MCSCVRVYVSKKILCNFTGPAVQGNLVSVHPTTRQMCFTSVLNKQ